MSETMRPARFTPAVFEKYTADYSSTVQVAVDGDGQAWTRIRSRHPTYGYQWSAWRTVSFVNDDGLRLADGKRVRLPAAT